MVMTALAASSGTLFHSRHIRNFVLLRRTTDRLECEGSRLSTFRCTRSERNKFARNCTPSEKFRTSALTTVRNIASGNACGTLFYSAERPPVEFPFMSHQPPRADGARVLADLRALRTIGAYKTGVHKPTFSEPHLQSLQWLVQRLPDAGLAGEIDGIGNILGTSTKPGPKLLA